MTSYRSAHRKVYAAKGRASDLTCVECGSPAYDWAYDGRDPEERRGSNGAGRPELAYSMNPDHYEPKCRPCHLRGDLAVEVCARGHVMDTAGTRANGRGCAQCHRDRNATYQARSDVRDRNNARARGRTREQRDTANARAREARRRRISEETPEQAIERKARAARAARERRARAKAQAS